MGIEFSFQDFVNDEGANVVRLWLDGIPKGAKAKFNNWLRHLEATPPGRWTRPLVDTLDGHCTGLFEIRVALSHQQFRILGAHRERQPVLLHCFVKEGARVSVEECNQALARNQQIDRDPNKYCREHDYG